VKLKGVNSAGMLCSGKLLGLTEEEGVALVYPNVTPVGMDAGEAFVRIVQPGPPSYQSVGWGIFIQKPLSRRSPLLKATDLWGDWRSATPSKALAWHRVHPLFLFLFRLW